MNNQPLTPAQFSEMRQLSEMIYAGVDARIKRFTKQETETPQYQRYRLLVIRNFNH